MSALFEILLTILGIFLILLILVQRGRGGGLTGALGGMGGSSAFGAKAGDVFTRITIVTATIWIGLCVAAAYWSNPNHHGDRLGSATTALPASSAPVEDKKLPASTNTTGPASTDSSKSDTTPSTSSPPISTPPTESIPPAEAPAPVGK